MAARLSPRGVEALAAAALAAAALAVRWPLVGAPVYGDEAAHFAMADRMGASGGISFFEGGSWNLAHLVVGRPLFPLLHGPGAWIGGFEGFRILGAVFSALLPAALFVLARRLGVRAWLAFAAGAVVAVHPAFVVWGARIFPDSLMALFVLAGLAAYASGHRGWSFALLAGAVWVKESAIGALAGVVAFEAATLWRDRGAADRWRRVQPFAALAIAPVPLLIGQAMFPLWPGYASGGDLPSAIETLLPSAWLLLPLVAAWWVPRTRPAAAAAAGLFALYAFHVLVRGRLVQGWYVILPAALALVLAAAVVDAGLRSRRWPRMVAPPLAVGLAGLLAVGIVGSAGLASVVHPLAPRAEAGLADTMQAVGREGADVDAMVRFAEARRPANVVQVDVFWHWVDYPLSGTESTVIAYPVYGTMDSAAVSRLALAAESSDLVWFHDWGATPFKEALLRTYGDCEVFSSGVWTAYDLSACQGRSAAMADAYGAAA